MTARATSFKPIKSYIRQAIISILILIFTLIGVILIGKIFFKTQLASIPSAVTVAVILIVRELIGLFWYRRLSELIFDEENRQVLIYASQWPFKVKHRKISFDDVVLEIDGHHRYAIFNLKSEKLTFLKNKLEVFDISRTKDGLSSQTIKDIISTHQELGLQVKWA